MHSNPLTSFRLDLESRMPPAAWKRICDHHLNEAIAGNTYSGRFVLWLMTILDQELVNFCVDKDLLRRWIRKPQYPKSLKRSRHRPRHQQ